MHLDKDGLIVEHVQSSQQAPRFIVLNSTAILHKHEVLGE